MPNKKNKLANRGILHLLDIPSNSKDYFDSDADILTKSNYISIRIRRTKFIF